MSQSSEEEECDSFSINNDEGIRDLMEELNSSYSAEVEVSFDCETEFYDDVFSVQELQENKNNRKGIPEDVQ